ncbi:MAG: Ig domain protein group 2 domain protein [Paenibacillaceae bacterium]|nr:Ig domain protein group 2 domain protein [Paenibacillaceae bacterium]
MTIKQIISWLMMMILILPLTVAAPAYADEAVPGNLEGMNNAVIFKTGESYAYVRGGRVSLGAGQPTPYLSGGVAYLPLAFLAESQHSRMEWDSGAQLATVFLQRYELVFQAGSNNVVKRDPATGQEETLDMGAAAQLGTGNNLSVPVRGFAGAAGFLHYTDTAGGLVLYGTGPLLQEPGPGSGTLVQLQSLFAQPFHENAVQASFYVDPELGDDEQNDGSGSSPFQTIERARQAVREYKENLVLSGHIVVYLRGGQYFLEETLSFTEEDSGQNGYKVIYKAYPGETPVINGGRSVQGWTLHEGAIYKADIGVQNRVQLIFENGVFGKKARYPNEGYNTALAASAGISKSEFRFAQGTLPEVADSSQLEVSIWAGGFAGVWNWFQDIIGVKEFNYNRNTIKLNKNASYDIGTGSRYFIEGGYELLDSPGEFYLSGEGILYYYPLHTPIEQQNIVIPVAGDIISVKGSSPQNPVHDITFEGLSVCNSDRGKNGFVLANATHITLNAMHIFNIGQTAYKADGFAQNNTVENSLIENIGKDGIHFNGAGLRLDTINQYNVVRNNRLDQLGLILGHAYPIYLYNSGYNYVGHNRISNSKRYAIAFNGSKIYDDGKVVDGVTVTYTNWNNYTHTRYNVIEYNDCFLTYTDSQDVGAIYSWNAGLGNVVRNNLIHSNNVPFSHSEPLYFDDGSDDVTAYNNIIYNNQNDPASKGYLNEVIASKGVGIRLYNNILANNQDYAGADRDFPAVASLPMSLTDSRHNLASRNIIYESGNYLIDIPENNFNTSTATGRLLKELGSPVEERFAESDYNLYYNSANKYLPKVAGVNLSSLEDWLAWENRKYDQHSLFGHDPLFMDPANGDYRLRYDSPAHSLGFRDIAVQEIGLTADYPFAVGNGGVERVYVSPAGGEGKSYAALPAGGSLDLETAARTADGYLIDLNAATVAYASTAPAVAGVDAQGRITAMAPGVAEIQASVTYQGTTRQSSFHVLIDDEPGQLQILFNGGAWEPGTERKAQLRLSTEMGRLLVPAGGTFASSDGNVLTVDQNGLVTATGAGEADLTATAVWEGVPYSASVRVTVKEQLFKRAGSGFSEKILKLGQSYTVQLAAYGSNNQEYDIGSTEVAVSELLLGTGQTPLIDIEKVDDGLYTVTPLRMGMSGLAYSVSADGQTDSRTLKFAIIEDGAPRMEGWETSNYSSGTAGSFDIYEDGFYTLESNGMNIWGTADQNTFGFKRLALDETAPRAEIIASFDAWPGAALDSGAANQSHMGIMIRDADTANAKNVALRYWQTGKLRATWRKDTGGSSSYAAPPDADSPIQFRMVRNGNMFYSFTRSDSSEPWKLASEVEVAMGNEILIGLAGYSGNLDGNGQPIMTGMYGYVQVRTGDEVDLSDIAAPGSTEPEYEVSEALKQYAPLKDKSELNIVYLGGSITYGSKATDPNLYSWRSMVSTFFKEAYPGKVINNINAGIGGTGSDYGLLRLHDDVIAKEPDLVFVEFAVNDRTASDYNRIRKQMEGIVRNLLAQPEPPLIVFVYTATDQFDAIDTVHQEIADYYGIPSINIQAYVEDKVAQGQVSIPGILADSVHPNNAGHELYARYIMECLNNPAVYLKVPVWQATPLRADYYPYTGMQVPVQEGQTDGAWAPEGSGLVTSVPGASVTFQFEGPILALRNKIGPDYGKLEINIDNGNVKQVVDLYSTAAGLAMFYKNFELEDTGHTATITATGEKRTASTGVKIGLDGILVKRAEGSPAPYAEALELMASPGSATGTTSVTAAVYQAGDIFRLKVYPPGTTAPGIPRLGNLPPSDAAAYTLGGDVQAAAGASIALYKVDGSGRIAAYGKTLLTGEHIRSAASQALQQYERFVGKSSLNVVYLGSSATYGLKATDPNKYSWRALVSAFFKEAFPEKTIANFNAGYGGTGSDHGLIRLYDDVISKQPDLVFVDFAASDKSMDPDKVRRQMEGIVRNLLQAPSQPLVVFIYTPTKAFDAMDTVHQEIADYYGISSINIQSYIQDRVEQEELVPDDLFADALLPNNAGYALFADYIMECLNNPALYLKEPQWQEVPRRADYYPYTGMQLAASTGQITGSWTAAGGTIMTAQDSGAALTFTFDGPMLALRARVGPANGKLQLNIDNGSLIRTIDTYGASQGTALLFRTLDLSDGPHTVTITVLGEKQTASTGTLVGIESLTVKKAP